MGLLAYHLRLAIGGLRRDLRLSVAVFVCLALGSGMWTMVVSHYLREYSAPPSLSPALHQVEILHPRALALDRGTSAEHSSWHARTRVTYPEYELLSASGIPSRQTGTLRARLLVGGALSNARFVDADFFPLFQLPMGRGRAFTRDEEARGDAVLVISRGLDQRLRDGDGAGDSVGRELVVEGRPFRIVGVLAEDQAYRPEWDVVWTGKDQDALYLPLRWSRPLAAWPEQAVLQSPVSSLDDLWRSDAVMMTFWAELPGVEGRAAYARYLAQKLGPSGTPYQLRAYPEWRAAFPPPDTDILFFTVLLAIGLCGAAFTAAHLQLAKGLARREQLGIHRALGATRGVLFARQMVEAAVIALPAALVGLPDALILHGIYNRGVLENDIPVRLTLLGSLLGVGPAFALGLLAAAYPAWRMARTPPTVYLGRV